MAVAEPVGSGLVDAARSARLATVAVALLVLVAACAPGGGTKAGEATAKGGDRQTTSTVARNEPANPMAAAPYIEKLLGRYDRLVQEIVAHPAAVEDRGEPLVQEFLALFPRSNEFADGSLEGWVAQAGRGVTIKPLAAGTPVSATKLDGSFRRVCENTISYGQCTILNYVLSTKGVLTERVKQRRLAGDVKAIRVRGHWLLFQISTPPGATNGCEAEGGVRR